MLIFLCTRKLGSCKGISFIDSFKLEACHSKRASSHKTLKGIAKKGKTSMGWCYGMKVHLVINHFGELVINHFGELVINHFGEIITFYISSGNVADNNELILFKLTKNIIGKLFGDKGYIISAERLAKLYESGIQLITKVRKNMQNKCMNFIDKLLLGKRGIIESVGDILKEHLHMEHTRHRSAWGFFLHIVTSLTAYQIRDKKTSLSVDTVAKLLNT